MYALLGSGMHGKNGISPIITVQMWNTFVIPRLLHGIELLDVRKKDLEDLEVYQRKILKQLQSLPERTASVAVLGLVGVKTIEAQIDIKILTTFLNIAKDPSSLEHQLAHRQLLIKSENSCSWFIKVKQILHKYDLPEPVYLLYDIRSEKANKRPKGPHIVHLSTMCHLFGGLARVAILFFPIGPKNTNLVEDVEILLPVKFRWILFSGFRGEVGNVSANQRPGRPSCFSDRPEKHKLGRGRWDLASCQVSLNSVQWFQRRSRKCLSQSEARAAILFFQSAWKTKTW